MLDDFKPYGIEMVAISPDTVKESRRTKRMAKLNMPILSDADIKVIDLFGVRHPKGIGAPRNGSLIRPLAIPTTFLIDADGKTLWIDQADDYRVRSNPDRVLAAVKDNLGSSPAA